MTDAEDHETDLDSLAEFVRAESESAIARRSTIDTRALAALTAAFAVGTFYFAVSNQLLKGSSECSILYTTCEYLGLGLLTVSALIAVFAIFPGTVYTPDHDQLTRYLDAVETKTSPGNYKADITQARIAQLKTLKQSSSRKALVHRWQLGSLGAGLALLCLAVLFFVA